MSTVALAIPTSADWNPERAESLSKLKAALGIELHHSLYREFRDKCHHTVWATDMWRFFEDSGADWGLSLQDDVIPAPNFWKVLHAIMGAVPDDVEVICLESAHPQTPLLHVADEPWFSVSEGLIGVAYLARPKTYAAFRQWRETKLKPGAWFPGPQCITEDTLFGHFCLNTGRAIYCPTRTIVDHNVNIPSTNGPAFDAHPNRRPKVRWDNAGIPLEVYEDPAYWTMRKDVPHLGRVYGDGTILVAQRWVEGITPDDVERMKADDGKITLRMLLGNMLLSGQPVDLCCLCGRHAAAAIGMTGLQVCPGCVGVCAKVILTNMAVE